MKSAIQQRRELHAAGLSDVEIARATGAKRNTITVWRRSAGLPANIKSKRMSDSASARRMLLYQLGWSDHHIAREEGVALKSVQEWRSVRELKSNFRHGVNERYRQRPTLTDVFVRVRRAVGRSLARDVADDAVMDLVRDVLDGTIPLAEIEKVARRYGNRVLDRFASRYGPRSLDEERGDDDGYRIIDLIRDDRSSSWLEEMGSTVW